MFVEIQCLNCCRKHIGAAHAPLGEYVSGRYPENFWKAIGNLWLAELHTAIKWPNLSKAIEAQRVEMVDDDSFWPDLDGLLKIATDCAKQEVQNINKEQKNSRRKI